MAKQKTYPTESNVEDYINSLPSLKKIEDGHVSLNLLKRITKLQPRLWSPTLIGFGKYHYKYESGHEGYAPELAFSPQKTRQVFYVIDGSKIQKQLLIKLGKYKTGKVCLYINKLADIDLNVLEKILIESWKSRSRRIGC